MIILEMIIDSFIELCHCIKAGIHFIIMQLIFVGISIAVFHTLRSFDKDEYDERITETSEFLNNLNVTMNKIRVARIMTGSILLKIMLKEWDAIITIHMKNLYCYNMLGGKTDEAI
jgi:hypothetical protein